jgi:hypothetical protein
LLKSKTIAHRTPESKMRPARGRPPSSTY